MTKDPDATYPKSQLGKPVALEVRANSTDGRRYAPSTARNKQVILDVFWDEVGDSGRILEIASGTGEHGAFFTENLRGLQWTYSDIDAGSRDSQTAWKEASGHARLNGPLVIDASKDDWGDAEASAPWDGVVAINMIHISPFAATEGLIAGAGRLLKPGGKLFLYGPFSRNGEIAPSNAAFSGSLQSRDPAWGVRDLDVQIVPLAEKAGLALQTVVEMPANNLCVIFDRAG